jgi:hypothetical protein
LGEGFISSAQKEVIDEKKNPFNDVGAWGFTDRGVPAIANRFAECGECARSGKTRSGRSEFASRPERGSTITPELRLWRPAPIASRPDEDGHPKIR